MTAQLRAVAPMDSTGVADRKGHLVASTPSHCRLSAGMSKRKLSAPEEWRRAQDEKHGASWDDQEREAEMRRWAEAVAKREAGEHSAPISHEVEREITKDTGFHAAIDHHAAVQPKAKKKRVEAPIQPPAPVRHVVQTPFRPVVSRPSPLSVVPPMRGPQPRLGGPPVRQPLARSASTTLSQPQRLGAPRAAAPRPAVLPRNREPPAKPQPKKTEQMRVVEIVKRAGVAGLKPLAQAELEAYGRSMDINLADLRDSREFAIQKIVRTAFNLSHAGGIAPQRSPAVLDKSAAQPQAAAVKPKTNRWVRCPLCQSAVSVPREQGAYKCSHCQGLFKC